MTDNFHEMSLNRGDLVEYEGKLFSIKAPLNLSEVLLEDPITGEMLTAPIHDLSTQNTAEKTDAFSPGMLLNVSASCLEITRQRQAILDPLAKKSRCKKAEIEQAMQQLSLSSRQVYHLLHHYRQMGYQLRALIPFPNTGGKNGSRLLPAIEQILQDCIQELYLSPQKLKPSIIIEEVRRRCYHIDLKAPAGDTIRRRLKQLSLPLVLRKRQGRKVAHYQTDSFPGQTPEVKQPLCIFQIDHTLVDLMIVDSLSRQCIGRPYLTVAIDVYSRCIAGFCLTLEPPSATSVGLCLAHAVCDKTAWLQQRHIESQWPIWGKPDCIAVDNAKEFHSEALQRGCDFHGIRIDYRPPGQPHWGGIIERVMGTFMQLVHQLPGTTFSNIQEKGKYPSEKLAALTLEELEHWLTIAIVDYYHQKLHGHLQCAPVEYYRRAILGTSQQPGIGYPPRIKDQKAFLIDFLPILHRQLRCSGITVDHITYFNNNLTPLIAERRKYGQVIIRRDPRDLSRIYLLDPRSQAYLEVPYRHLARPTISLWEHRQAYKQLRKEGMTHIDESQLFMAIEKLRSIAKEAVKISKKVRREQARRQNNKRLNIKEMPPINHFSNANDQGVIIKTSIKPFTDIQKW